MDDRGRADIVDFWRVVEMFSPPSIPAVDDRRWVFRVEPGRPLPWEPDHRLRQVEPEPNMVWRHTVYLGSYPLTRVVEVMAQLYGDDPESFDVRMNGTSALAAFTVDEDGTLVLGSVVLSSCAWATGEAVHQGGSGRLDGLDDAQIAADELIRSMLRPLTAPEAATVAAPIDADGLYTVLDELAALLGVEDVLAPEDILVRSTRVHRKRADVVDDDFLNSFIVDDLGHVAGEIRAGRYGSAVRAYLSDEVPAPRVDLRQTPEASLEGTRPEAVPLGRWPANPAHPLALSQQFAVDYIVGQQSSTGISAVNGPPGTGKTTMLRDLVAAIVVQRAERLATLTRPGDAFRGRLRWKMGDRELTINLWRPDLTGHEIVVASSNNGAVENVTTEIPGAGAIDERWAGVVDYFPELATALLNVDKPDLPPAERDPAWAMVAARLGKKPNRVAFTNTMWFGRSEPRADGAQEPPTLRDLLAEAATLPPAESWATCVARFRAVVARAEDSGRQRSAVYAELAAVQRHLQEGARAAETARAAAGRAASADERARALTGERVRSGDQVATMRQHRSDHLRSRPNLAQAIFSRHRLREWEQLDDVLAERLRRAEDHHHRVEAELDAVLRVLEQARRDAATAEDHVQRMAQAHEQACAAVAAAQQRWGSFVPGADWWADEQARELAAPWTDPEWNAERSEVFLAALRLHRDFLEHEPRRMTQNLSAAADVLTGAAPRDLDETTALAAWQSLFFVVPVVSTTFASFARVFSHLGCEALGWLFVDEAGQATPQNAVGALWRSRRAVIVGDPLQLEPVVTLPFRAQQSLRIDHRVAERWLPQRTSVQSLADQLMPVGTSLPDGPDGPRWVGAPLRVHRRCDEPMFGVINRVVYDGLMVYGITPPRAAPVLNGLARVLPDTKWINVCGRQSEGHWVPAEGEKLDEMLGYMHRHGQDMSQVMIIGPFRDVAAGVRRIAGKYPGVRAGTVHTAQGKEADIVVLVLGSDPRSPGARQWAAEKPNLMNVAVSRARRRLYVIGDRAAWKGQPYFGDLAETLPVRD